MKMKAFFLALAVTGAAAAFGLTAAGRTDTGTTTTGETTTSAATTTGETTPSGCRRFELKGTVASVSGSSLVVTVTKGSKAAKAAGGTAVTVTADAGTKVVWQGRGTFSGPNAGDAVSVNGKVCSGTYTAAHVTARTAKADEAGAAKPEDASKDKSGDHGSTKHK
jgi:hypothetical protein